MVRNQFDDKYTKIDQNHTVSIKFRIEGRKLDTTKILNGLKMFITSLKFRDKYTKIDEKRTVSSLKWTRPKILDGRKNGRDT